MSTELNDKGYATVATLSTPGKFVSYTIRADGLILETTDNINPSIFTYKTFLNAGGWVDSIRTLKDNQWYETRIFQNYDKTRQYTLNSMNKGAPHLGYYHQLPFGKVIFRYPDGTNNVNTFDYKYDDEGRIKEVKITGPTNFRIETYTYY